MNNKLRQIKWTAYKQSGKYYSEGLAFIDSTDHYFNSKELLKDISETQDGLVVDSFLRSGFIFTVQDITDNSFPFIDRLINTVELYSN